ncbi:MAG: hypothetical protein IH588_11395 [Anaerolineales bacterium]|nr:hypothetical protein [Anaerolineales bacterium]
MKSFLFSLSIVLWMTGCASLATQTAAATPALPIIVDEWTVEMTHSGGIMGLMRAIKISSGGSYTVTDERANKTISGELSKDELAKLTEIITNTSYITSEKPKGVCADCFIYDIEIQGSGKNLAVQLDDISLPGSGMENLVTFLRGLIDSSLK